MTGRDDGTYGRDAAITFLSPEQMALVDLLAFREERSRSAMLRRLIAEAIGARCPIEPVG